MLPTNEKAPVSHKGIIKQGDSLLFFDKSIFISKDVPRQPQHLYFLSDEEIKDGDWYYDLTYKQVFRNKAGKNTPSDNWKKIIVTTDKSLEVVSKGINPVYEKLPQPSQQFIEKYVEDYNKGNIITDVMVEYITTYRNTVLGVMPEQKLKIDKDNCITTYKLKNSWSREEVIKIIDYCWGYKNESIQTKREWIEQNL